VVQREVSVCEKVSVTYFDYLHSCLHCASHVHMVIPAVRKLFAQLVTASAYTVHVLITLL
jgi:hypothetical protein